MDETDIGNEYGMASININTPALPVEPEGSGSIVPSSGDQLPVIDNILSNFSALGDEDNLFIYDKLETFHVVPNKEWNNSGLTSDSFLNGAVSYIANVTKNPVCLLYLPHTTDSLLRMSIVIPTVLIFIIALFGITFNIIGICVLWSGRIKRTSTRLYLLVLALSDSCYLTAIILTRGLEGLKCMFVPDSSMDIYHQYSFTCKGLQYMLDLFADFSSCIILTFTVERFIACYFGVFYKENCNVHRARIVLIVIFICIAVTIIPHHMIYMEHNQDKNICTVSKKSVVTFNSLYIAETSIFRIIPTYLIAVFNIAIIKKLWSLYNYKKRTFVKSGSFTLSSTEEEPCNQLKYKENNNKISYLLVSISTFYLVCYQPIIICYIIMRVSSYTFTDAPRGIIIFRNFSRVLHILGFAGNFFFYILASKVFRQEMKRKFCIYFKTITHK